MVKRTIANQKLIGLFLLASVLLNFPIIGIFGRSVLVMGIPLLYLYIFLVWLLLIVAIAMVVERQN